MILSSLGWNSIFEKAWNEKDRGPHSPARVIETQKSIWRLASETGECLAQMAPHFRHKLLNPQELPAVGDWVEAGDGAIFDVLPRQSKISRLAAGRRTEEQIVAANIDTVFVVSSLDADFNPRRLERYLMMVCEGGAQPVIVLNKADLCDDVPRFRMDMEAAAPGVAVYIIGARDAMGLGQLGPHLRSGGTIALVGSSGVGKSTLINQLCGVDRQAVSAVRADGRGRHTTTTRSLIQLPSGALLIDTPGMRELQLWATEGSLDSTFEEIDLLAKQCRFRDCGHTGEPGCAILQSVNNGNTPQDRYDSYLKLRKEVASSERKQDVSAELEVKRKWKATHRTQKATKKMDLKVSED
jgi:ribosome biogenesis GTPase